MPQPLTQEQFQGLKQQGYTTEKIIEFEKRRLAETPKEEAIIPEILFPEEIQRRKQEQWDIRHPVAKKLTNYFFPQMLTDAEFERGQRNIYGDIFERPASAIRSALMGKGYVQGALVPEEIPTFEQETKRLYPIRTTDIPTTIADIITRLPLQMGAQATDVITNPAQVLSLLLGLAPQTGTVRQQAIKDIGRAEGLVTQTGQKIATSPIGQMTQKGLANITQATKALPSKMPKIMGEKWFESDAKLAQKTASGLERMRGAAYQNIYSELNKAPVDPIKINTILQKYDLIDELGSPSSMNIQQAKQFGDELAQYIPQTIKKGQIYGKGGWANPKIRAEKAAEEIKNLIYQSGEEAEKVGIIKKGSTQSLKNLDKLAREQLYPRAEKIRSIGGYSPEPETSGISSAYRILRGSEGAAGKRLAIKRAPQSLKELGQYIAPEEKDKLAEAIKNARQLSKNMRKYRSRQLIKTLATGGAGAIALWDYLFRRKIAGEVLR